MKILLTGHGRCGSTSLHYGLSDIMNHKMVLEPFNRELWKSYYKTNPPFQKGDEIDENVIFKTLSGHSPDWIEKNYSKFDRTIILMRDNLRDTVLSHQNAIVHGYLNEYKGTENITKKSLEYVFNNYKWLIDFHKKTVTSRLIWYNDIYTTDFNKSKDTIRSLDLNLSEKQLSMLYEKYLNPRFRLRKN